jgi:hypothetical protein
MLTRNACFDPVSYFAAEDPLDEPVIPMMITFPSIKDRSLSAAQGEMDDDDADDARERPQTQPPAQPQPPAVAADGALDDAPPRSRPPRRRPRRRLITCQMLALARREWFAEWEGESGNHPEGGPYLRLKQRWRERLIGLLLQR